MPAPWPAPRKRTTSSTSSGRRWKTHGNGYLSATIACPTLQGKYKVPHYDSKGSIDHFFTDLGLPVTLMRTSFYWDSLYMFKMGPSQGKGDEYELTFPMGDKQIPGIAAEDIGGCAYGIFKAGR